MIAAIATTGPVSVVLPRPDVMVLNAGGIIARLALAGAEVHVCIAARPKQALGMLPPEPETVRRNGP